MRIAIIIIVCISLLLTVGCSSKSNNINDAKDILPLEIGKKFYATVHMVYSETEEEYLQDAFEIERIVTVNDEQWYNVLFFLDGGSMGSALMTNRNDGLWFWATTSEELEGEPYLWIKYPISIGDTYIKNGNPVEDFELVAIDTSIAVPYGTFDCFCYKGTSFDGDIVVHRFYAPDVGLIKFHNVNSFVIPTMHTYWELDSITEN